MRQVKKICVRRRRVGGGGVGGSEIAAPESRRVSARKKQRPARHRCPVIGVVHTGWTESRNFRFDARNGRGVGRLSAGGEGKSESNNYVSTIIRAYSWPAAGPLVHPLVTIGRVLSTSTPPSPVAVARVIFR